jgi:hypothetical protein
MKDDKYFDEIGQKLIEERKKDTQYYRNLITLLNGNSFAGGEDWKPRLTNTYPTKRPMEDTFVDYEYDVQGDYCFFDLYKLGEPILVDGPNFKYRFNEHGFRSKGFKEFNKDNVNILFSGCSITAGVGLPEDLTWYKKLYDKISLDKSDQTIDFYNLGISGASITLIYKNLITFIKTVGKPDYIFLLLPNMSRNFTFSKESNKFGGVNFLKNPTRSEDIKYKESYVHENTLLTTSMLINTLETFCELSDIKLIWSSWIPEDNLFFEDLGFKYFLNFKENLFKYTAPPDSSLEEDQKINNQNNYDTLVEFLNMKNKNKEPYWHSAREGHPGSYFTSVCADKYFQEFKRRGL